MIKLQITLLAQKNNRCTYIVKCACYDNTERREEIMEVIQETQSWRGIVSIQAHGYLRYGPDDSQMNRAVIPEANLFSVVRSDKSFEDNLKSYKMLIDFGGLDKEKVKIEVCDATSKYALETDILVFQKSNSTFYTIRIFEDGNNFANIITTNNCDDLKDLSNKLLINI